MDYLWYLGVYSDKLLKVCCDYLIIKAYLLNCFWLPCKHAASKFVCEKYRKGFREVSESPCKDFAEPFLVCFLFLLNPAIGLMT